MKRIGLVDIGSNTVRLVLFEYNEETGLKELQNIKTPARLARYLDEDNVMAEEGSTTSSPSWAASRRSARNMM